MYRGRLQCRSDLGLRFISGEYLVGVNKRVEYLINYHDRVPDLLKSKADEHESMTPSSSNNWR